jgi:hypothetical protein
MARKARGLRLLEGDDRCCSRGVSGRRCAKLADNLGLRRGSTGDGSGQESGSVRNVVSFVLALRSWTGPNYQLSSLAVPASQRPASWTGRRLSRSGSQHPVTAHWSPRTVREDLTVHCRRRPPVPSISRRSGWPTAGRILKGTAGDIVRRSWRCSWIPTSNWSGSNRTSFHQTRGGT